MDLNVDDDGFVRAPIALVYRHLTDLTGYPAWWPGTAVQSVGEDTYALDVRDPAGRGRLQFTATAHGWRHDAGFRLTLDGDVQGEAEWWLEDGWGGTVVHHLLAATTSRDARRRLRTYRSSLRHGLWATKDRLQPLTREAVGLAP